jgi:hypothetical protein
MSYYYSQSISDPRFTSVQSRVYRRRRNRLSRLEYYILYQILCQLALLMPFFQGVRVLARLGAFGASILMLMVSRSKGPRHPADKPALWVLLIIVISIFHPATNSFAAGAAEVGLYVAIIAPLFWVPGLKLNLDSLRRAFCILWAFYSLSATVGVLQVYFPGRFQFALSSVVSEAGGGHYASQLMIKTNTGQEVLRPMGLTDYPGGAAVDGLNAVIMGMALLARSRKIRERAIFAGSMIVGLAAIALSQVRVMAVVAAVSIIVFIALTTFRNLKLAGRRTIFGKRPQMISMTFIVGTLAGVILLAAVLAMSLARGAVVDRLSTLVTQNESEVYYSNRGIQLDYTIRELLPEYPLGAGLGRWGMIFHYFGDPYNPDSPPLWSEIQWTGWLFDGGVPLIIAYLAALWLAGKYAFFVALHRDSADLAIFAAAILAFDVGAFAATFDADFFISQGALQFWLLNAVLFAAATAFSMSPRHGSRSTPRSPKLSTFASNLLQTTSDVLPKSRESPETQHA